MDPAKTENDSAGISERTTLLSLKIVAFLNTLWCWRLGNKKDIQPRESWHHVP
jgi:hypothetical protein